MPFRLGTRGSALARWQAEWVAAALRRHGHEVELVTITTTGDRYLGSIDRQMDRGLFTKEVQNELLAGRIDLAVHSLKDLPTEPVGGLTLAAVPERAAVEDALLAVDYASLEALPPGARVGTGSTRRRAQLLRARPDLTPADLRGNVDTRIGKLKEGQYAAIILAVAGLQRLGFGGEIRQVLPLGVMLPAVGQGALAIEARTDDAAMIDALSAIDHPPTHGAVLAERMLLSSLEGGCMAPVAAYAQMADRTLRLRARVLAPDGSKALEAVGESSAEDARGLGRRVAAELLAQGAAGLIAESRG